MQSYLIAENTCIKNRALDNWVDPVSRATEECKTHPSVPKIKDEIPQGNKFSFIKVSQSEIEKKTKNLNVKKAATYKNVLPKVLKISIAVISETLQQLFNQALNTGCLVISKRQMLCLLFKRKIY